VPPPEPSGPATPGPAVAPPAGVEDAEARAARIRERHRRIAGEDYFRRLGLPRSANREAVKRAFFEAAKQYHPDRVPKELAHLVPELKDIFSAVNEAYEVLQDEERRRTYEASLNAGDARPPVDQQLRGLVQVAQTAMRHRAFADAERAYRQAASLQERPDLLAHAAWAVLSDPARRDDAPRMRTELASIAASHPRSPEAHYYLGVIARSEHDEEAAERHFRAALHANPKHAEAAQELRRLQKRRPGPGRR
jgi:tetratricopeptide (TPR) repeat protein